jgi:hypothetical protein
LIGEIIASPISARLMEHHTWLPIFLGLGSLILANWLVLAIPETFHLRLLKVTDLDQEPSNGSMQDASEHDPLPGNATKGEWWRWLESRVSRIRIASQFIWDNKYVMLLLFTFLITTLGRFLQELLMQYATKRFNWSWSKVSLPVKLIE